VPGRRNLAGRDERPVAGERRGRCEKECLSKWVGSNGKVEGLVFQFKMALGNPKKGNRLGYTSILGVFSFVEAVGSKGRQIDERDRGASHIRFIHASRHGHNERHRETDLQRSGAGEKTRPDTREGAGRGGQAGTTEKETGSVEAHAGQSGSRDSSGKEVSKSRRGEIESNGNTRIHDWGVSVLRALEAETRERKGGRVQTRTDKRKKITKTTAAGQNKKRERNERERTSEEFQQNRWEICRRAVGNEGGVHRGQLLQLEKRKSETEEVRRKN